jgi:type III secretion inner rod protein HrpB2
MTLPIDAIGAVQHLAEVAKASPPTVATDQLAARFESMLKPADAPQRPSQAAAPEESPNAISRALDTQEAYLKQTIQDTDAFAKNIHLYSSNEIAAVGHMLAQKTAFGAIALNASMAVAQSSNKSLQSLLKNQ